MPKTKSERWPYFLLIVLGIIFWWRILFAGQTLFYDSLTRSFFPWFALLKESIKAGQFPLWNPYIYSGMPHFAAMNGSCLYPFAYLFAFLSFPTALSITAALHTVLAGLFMALLARELFKNSWASAIAGIIFMLNGFFIYHTVFLHQFFAYTWIPLIFYLTLRSLKEGWFYMALTALVLTLQFFAGQPQFSLLTLGALFLFVILLSQKERMNPIRSAAVLAGIFVLFILLSAVQWIPSMELAVHSVRKSGLSFQDAVLYSESWANLFRFFFMPQWNAAQAALGGDIHIMGFYIGLPALALAVLGAWKGKKSSVVLFGLVLFGICLILSLGSHTPLYEFIFNWFPPLRLFRFPAQFLYGACFALALLAAYGMSQWKAKSFWKAAVLLLIVLDLSCFAWRAVQLLDKNIFSQNLPTVEFLKQDSSLYRIWMTPRTRDVLGQRGDSAYEAWMRFMDSLYPDISAAYKLQDADGHDQLRLMAYERIRSELYRNPNTPWMRLLNIKYLLSFWDVRDPDFEKVYQDSIKVLQNKKAGPRAFFTPFARAASEDEAFQLISAGQINLYKEILISSPFNLKAQSEGKGQVWVNQYSPNRITLQVQSEVPGYVFLADSWFPGWEGKVNGQSVPILKAQYAFRAVEVPQGASIVEMVYSPMSFKIGVLISSLGLLALLLLLIKEVPLPKA